MVVRIEYCFFNATHLQDVAVDFLVPAIFSFYIGNINMILMTKQQQNVLNAVNVNYKYFRNGFRFAVIWLKSTFVVSTETTNNKYKDDNFYNN